jgi:predicted ATPase
MRSRKSMITWLTIENFKAHRSMKIRLGRLTVLVGPNGAGKTTVLQALRCLGQLVTQPATNVFRGAYEPGALLRRGASEPILVRIEGSSAGQPWSVSLQVAVSHATGGGAGSWTLRYDGAAPDGRSISSKDRGAAVLGSAGDFLRALAPGSVFRFDPRQIAAPSYSDEERPHVLSDGTNTASVLAALKLSDDERFEAIVNGLRKLVPAVKRVRIRPARVLRKTGNLETPGDHVIKTHEVMGHQIVFDFQDASDIAAQAVSEGTLVSLALLTLLHSESRSDLVLLDDIEQALHPTAQLALMKQLAGILELFPDLQIVATTHSPFILDGVAPEQVLVFFRRDSGDVVVRPLSDHPDAQRAKGTLSAGQIWTLDPESWVVSPEAAE